MALNTVPQWEHVRVFKGKLSNASTFATSIDGLSITTSLQLLYSVPGSDDPDQHAKILTQVWDGQAAVLEHPERLVATGKRALLEHGWDQDVPLETAVIFWRPDKYADPQQVTKTGQVSIRFRTPMVHEDVPSGVIGYAGVVFDFISLCLLYTSPSPRDQRGSRMPSSA